MLKKKKRGKDACLDGITAGVFNKGCGRRGMGHSETLAKSIWLISEVWRSLFAKLEEECVG